MKAKVDDVVQFLEHHKWVGCLGIVEEVKECDDDVRYMIGVPIPSNAEGTSAAYVFSMESKNEFDMIGKAALVPRRDEGKEE